MRLAAPVVVVVLLASACSSSGATTTSAAASSGQTPAGSGQQLGPPLRARPTVSPTPRPTSRPVPTRPRLPLTGRTIVLDPGHDALNSREPARADALVPAGGFSKPCNTSGTETDAGYPEHAFTFDVVQRAARLLRAQAAHVVLTRPDDAGFGPCVDERAALGNRNDAALVIAVHADGGPPSGEGFHVIEPALAPDGGNAAILASSARLALLLRATYRQVTGEPYASYTATDGLAKRSDLAGLNLSRVPAVFIECANMRGAADARRVTSAAFRQEAAVAIEQTALAYLR